MTLLLMLLLKTLLVFALSGAALLCLRRASASARHLVCLLTLASLLALPLFSVTLPGWQVAGLTSTDRISLPQEEAPPAPTIVQMGRGVGIKPGMTASLPVPLPNEASADPPSPAPHSAPAPHAAPSLLGAGGSFLALYLLGVFFAALRPLLGLWGIGHLRRACTPVTDAPTLEVFADCAAALGLKRLPLLFRMGAAVPMTWGWHRPVVLLPFGSENWPEDRLRSVLLHELAHIKRRDWPGHRLADMACALYWFHPIVWLTARRLRAESEAACDDLVLSSGIPAPDYARHLLDIAGALPPASRRPPYPAAIAMAQTSQIKGRITMILDKTQSRRAVTRRALLVVLVPSAAALIALAVLRPSIKAQAAPAAPVADTNAPHGSVTLPNGDIITLPKGSPPLNFRVGHTTSVQIGHTAGPGQLSLVTTSPNLTINGTTLFAGMTDAGKLGSSWWSATGALLPKPVYDTNAHHTENHVGSSRTHNVEFAFRLPATAQGITTDYKLPQSTGYSSDGEWPGKTQSDAPQTESQRFDQTGGTRIVAAAFPPTLKKTNVRVGIAAGAWKTAISTTINSSGAKKGTIRNSGSQDFILSPAVETTDGLLLTIATNSTDDLRIVAVNTQGHELLPVSIGGESENALDQITAHFSQPLSQIKAFQVQTRPFQWIEFKDVALQPVK